MVALPERIETEVWQKERIGFYICHCGINIAYKVRCPEVAAYIKTMPNVVVSRDYLFMCSDPGQELIEKDIKELGLNRVVVASCSPRMHEHTFRAACARAGLNPFRAFHHVCVREHVSWVTLDEDEATEKAKILSRAGVLRVSHQVDLFPKTFPVNPNTLVVGGGIAGMQASLDIASAGYKVYLVERQATIGGHMLQYDKTFPTLDCAACIGTPKMVAVGQHKNIEILSYSEVEDVSGFVGQFHVKVRKRARYVNADKCTGCGECAKYCPVEMPNEWDEGTLKRKAVYRPFPQAVPITFAIDKRDRGPCVQACPAGIEAQGYVALVGEGKYEEATRLIMEKVSLPGVLGRVCPAFCEAECRRKEVDEPLALRDLKRFAADRVDWETFSMANPEKLPPEEKVAVVGSGPAGIACADFLARKGYHVTVFEAQPVIGGMLRLGIPDYRLPPEVLDREVECIRRMGVDFQTGSPIGGQRGRTIDALLGEGYRTVFLGTGAHSSQRLRIEGEDGPGVMRGIEYLRRVNLGEDVPAAGQVVVIGGGNTAVDCARVARRQGAQVTIAYRRSRAEMPAHEREIHEAEEEGVAVQLLTAPVRLVAGDGKVTAVKCLRMELGEPDESGRRRPVPVAGSEFTIDCDLLLTAIGEKPDTACLEGCEAIEVSAKGLLESDPVTLQTARPGVFAGGDAHTGPRTVVDALTQGREAAVSIDRYLRGEDLLAGRPARPSGDNWVPIPKNIAAAARAAAAQIDPQTRIGSFEEVDHGLSEEQALAEAARCLSCGACSQCRLCVTACEARAIEHDQQDEVVDLEVGSIIVATGFDVMDRPEDLQPYGYGRLPNVITNLEFERLSNATGPTSGKILLRDPDDPWRYTQPPASVAILHCIGSRDAKYHEYCSRTCCMYALKFAHLIKDKCGHETQVYNFYIDMRCFGKGYEEFYRRVQSEGVRMIRGKAVEVTDRAASPDEEGLLMVTAEDSLTGKLLRVPVEMVVLCTAMESRTDAIEVARTFGISVGQDGFFMEEHPKLEPVSTPTSGVFLAGACQGPKDIPDSVAQAKAAASEAQALSTLGEVTVTPMISSIDPDVCIGCQVCLGLCPYTAIEFNDFRHVSVVNEALCKGCGSCAAYCPSGAAKIRHFTDRQIFAEIDGILMSA